MLLYLVCENCLQTVARFDPDDLSDQVEAKVFQSHLADRGVPPPWAPTVETRWMMCPYCRKRVFNVPDPRSLFVCDSPNSSVNRRLQLSEPEPDRPFVCQGCGKAYKTQQAFERYHKCQEE